MAIQDESHALADLEGGVPGTRPPRVQILSFWHTKFSKRNRSGLHTPLRGPRPPYGKSWMCRWPNNMVITLNLKTSPAHAQQTFKLVPFFLTLDLIYQNQSAAGIVVQHLKKEKPMILFCTYHSWSCILRDWSLSLSNTSNVQPEGSRSH